MITKMNIENFKPFKKIETELRGLNILMGLNGMGKTSFIQSLLLLMQSDNLEKGVLELNGLLTEIGQGRDALYQFAQDDHIVFGITLDHKKEYLWRFAYSADRKVLLSETDCSNEEKMKLFRKETSHFHYINTDRIGPRDLYDSSSFVVTEKKQLGLHGEYSAYYINIYGNEYNIPEILRHPNGSANTLLAQTSAWLKEISPGISLNTKYVPEIDNVILDYQFDYGKEKTNTFRPRNVGFGISYILPVIIALLTAEKGEIIIIENPESHIHPRGQVEIGNLIACAAQNGSQLFVETHSDHILNGIRVAVKENFVDKNKVNILFFDKKTSEKEQYAFPVSIQIDKNGSLSEYPENFLDEWSNQLSRLI
jgi:predicted ATPase